MARSTLLTQLRNRRALAKRSEAGKCFCDRTSCLGNVSDLQRSCQLGRCDGRFALGIEHYIERQTGSALFGAISVKREHRLNGLQSP